MGHQDKHVSHRAALGADDVRRIREQYARGKEKVTQGDLAEKYGVSQKTISNILLRRTYKHID